MSQIIELSNSNSSGSTNTEFISSFEPISINDGDSISIKNAFLDTKVQDASTQINIESDLTLTFEFGFYDINVPFDLNLFQRRVFCSDYSSVTNCDWGTYICMSNFITRELIQVETSIILPTGLYTNDSLASTITRLLAKNDVDGLSNVGTHRLRSTNQFYPGLLQFGDRTYPGDNNRVYYCACAPINMNNGIIYPESGGSYYYQSSSGFDVDSIFSIQIGAQQIALLYNQDNSNLFELVYHTPIYDADGTQCTAMGLIDGTDTIVSATRQTGIFFTDIQPRSFWQNLGFDIDKIIVSYEPEAQVAPFPAPTVPQLTNFNYATYSENLFSNAQFNAPKSGTNVKPSRFVYLGQRYDTGNYALAASNLYRGFRATSLRSFSQLSPYVLIELISNFSESNYKSNNNESRFISALVNKAYSSGSFIIGFNDSSIIYTHLGENFILSNIKVRLLDPKTKLPDQNIGTNNFIILQIDRANGPSTNN